ncbi:MAG: 30S ribosome-binding factor RbfA [Eubacterium sp.]|nr:30S ribosome-binding factor RbfA [Eubacterium sp.]
MRKNSIKNTRVNEEVLRRLSEIIRAEIKDPRINPMTSVVSVEVAPDLKTCKAYVSVLGDVQSQKDTLAGLRSAEGYIRHSLAKSINLRYTPQITFIIDQSIAYGVHMSHYIDQVNQKSGNGQNGAKNCPEPDRTIGSGQEAEEIKDV